jgi:hypothetical protein
LTYDLQNRTVRSGTRGLDPNRCITVRSSDLPRIELFFAERRHLSWKGPKPIAELLREFLSQFPDGPPAPLAVFISHQWDSHSDIYADVLADLEAHSEVRVVDMSIPERQAMRINEDELRAQLMLRIAEAKLVIAVLEPLTGIVSDWVRWEVEFAHQSRKPMLLVVPYGVTPDAGLAPLFDRVMFYGEEDIADAALSLIT